MKEGTLPFFLSKFVELYKNSPLYVGNISFRNVFLIFLSNRVRIYSGTFFVPPPINLYTIHKKIVLLLYIVQRGTLKNINIVYNIHYYIQAFYFNKIYLYKSSSFSFPSLIIIFSIHLISLYLIYSLFFYYSFYLFFISLYYYPLYIVYNKLYTINFIKHTFYFYIKYVFLSYNLLF